MCTVQQHRDHQIAATHVVDKDVDASKVRHDLLDGLMAELGWWATWADAGSSFITVGAGNACDAEACVFLPLREALAARGPACTAGWAASAQ